MNDIYPVRWKRNDEVVRAGDVYCTAWGDSYEDVEEEMVGELVSVVKMRYYGITQIGTALYNSY